MIIERLLAAAATAAGAMAWIAYLRADIVLSHYDAKAHLVVARRVFDNITPGWQQIGAVWLPLPHLINLIPTQVDFFYRTGAFASLVSIACLGIMVYAAARLVRLTTGSAIGAVTAAALLVLNPNILYLHATPMTEPVLLAATFLAVLWLYEWTCDNSDTVPLRLGLALFAAMWTRYEAWPVLAAALAASLLTMWRAGVPVPSLARRALSLGAWPAAAVLLFLVNSRITVGSWFVSGGFYVPDPGLQGNAVLSLRAIWEGTRDLSTRSMVVAALCVTILFVYRALRVREEARLLIPLALLAAAALPFYAFFEGHPFRIRYMVPVIAACALCSGLAAGVLRRSAALLLAAILIGTTLVQAPPWQADAPMVVEAQWDRPASAARRAVTACLAQDYRGEKVFASMGSLAHYMQELSHDGFDIADFINEGNGVIWELAMETGPAPHAGWMLVEERAEGGDQVALRLARDPEFARGMTRVCEGGGVALYRRDGAR